MLSRDSRGSIFDNTSFSSIGQTHNPGHIMITVMTESACHKTLESTFGVVCGLLTELSGEFSWGVHGK